MNIVLTREVGKNDELRSWMPSNANCAEVPVTRTDWFDEEVVANSLLATKTIFKSLAVTSERTSAYLHLLPPFLSSNAEVFSVGSSTTRALEAHGLTVCAQSLSGAKYLANQISQGPVLLLGAKGMRDELAALLRARFVVEVVHCYETRATELSATQQAELQGADVVIIGAPSAWQAAAPFISNDCLVVVPGESTAQAVRRSHSRVLQSWGPAMGTVIAREF